MSGNNNRDNTNYLLNVTISQPALVYLLIDNRLGDSNNTNAPTFDATHMQWVLDQGWAAVKTGINRSNDVNLADEVGIDEGADGSINNWYSVYRKSFPAGTFQLKQADNAGQNMYGVVVTSVDLTGVTVQDPGNVVGTGTNAWSYLVLEGEDYDSEADGNPDAGFVRVSDNGARTNALGNPILGANTTASKKGALFTASPLFGQHADKVTYKVLFNRPGTYYLYMRFTMFENGGNFTHYLNEDSFFVPPDFNKDPQTDWPLTNPANGQNGGYTEGCCDIAGFLRIPSVGNPTRVDHGADTNFWEGNFHWNDLLSSQFLVSGISGEPAQRFKYEVTPGMVGVPQTFTISYREAGVTIDLFLFSTHTNLLNQYSQEELDRLFAPVDLTGVTVQDPGNVVGTGTNAWSYLVLEGEDYDSEADGNPDAGFVRVSNNGARTNALGNPILGSNTTVSKNGALFTASPLFGQHADKVSYKVLFNRPGTYYLYMRFTMFENGGNFTHYLNEDSFFVPPDFNKDPQTDWPLTNPANGQNGGYTEGCCDIAGFLRIPSVGNPTRVDHGADTNFWEGNFHWNDLLSSQFLVSGISGEPAQRFKYEVTPGMVGVPQTFTISYREAGVTIDLFLFSTHTNLLNQYSQEELDRLFAPVDLTGVTVQDPGNVVGTGTNAWSYLVLEGEDYDSEADGNPDAGFVRVSNNGARTNALGNPILGANTTASKKGALFTASPLFGQHADKVSYKVLFNRPGTYYLYMRFTMF